MSIDILINMAISRAKMIHTSVKENGLEFSETDEDGNRRSRIKVIMIICTVKVDRRERGRHYTHSQQC